MKFTCTQENLTQGLGLVGRLASKNVALPILSNVLLVAEGGTIRLQTTNLELGLTTTVRAKVDREGSYTVQSRLLSDFISLLGDDQVTIELTDQGLSVTSSHSKTVIKGLPAEEFPVMPSSDTAASTSVPAPQLQQALEGVIIAVANDESRPEISGVLFSFQDDELIVAATDSYRLAERRLKLLQAVTPARQVIVPARTIQELLRVMPADTGEVTIKAGDNQIFFHLEHADVVSRLIEGRYPEYQQILPAQWQTKLVCPKDDFVANVRATSLFCKPSINDLTLLVKTEEKTFVLQAANTQVGEHEAVMKPEMEGQDREMVFNYRYLLDGLTSLRGESVSLEMTDNHAPGVLRSTSQPSDLYLLMPIRQ